MYIPINAGPFLNDACIWLAFGHIMLHGIEQPAVSGSFNLGHTDEQCVAEVLPD